MKSAAYAQVSERSSSIHGQGLFADADMPAGTDIGLAVSVSAPLLKLAVTSMGGMVNHSRDANVALFPCEGGYSLRTLRKVAAGEELLGDYDKAPWFIERASPEWNRGFMDKCAAYGLDPSEVVKFAEEMPKTMVKNGISIGLLNRYLKGRMAGTAANALERASSGFRATGAPGMARRPARFRDLSPAFNRKIEGGKTMSLRPRDEQVRYGGSAEKVDNLDLPGGYRMSGYAEPANDWAKENTMHINSLYHKDYPGLTTPIEFQAVEKLSPDAQSKSFERMTNVFRDIDDGVPLGYDWAHPLKKKLVSTLGVPVPRPKANLGARWREAADMFPDSTEFTTVAGHPHVEALYTSMGFKPTRTGDMRYIPRQPYKPAKKELADMVRAGDVSLISQAYYAGDYTDLPIQIRRRILYEKARQQKYPREEILLRWPDLAEEEAKYFNGLKPRVAPAPNTDKPVTGYS